MREMKMSFHVSLGGKDRTITTAELKEFERQLGLDRLAAGRCSQMLLAELLLWTEVEGHEPFQVARQIEDLENSALTSGTKPPSQFVHKPLRGLWHKHFFDAHFIGHNLSNEWTPKRLSGLLKEVFGSDPSTAFTEKMSRELAHRLVQGGLATRSDEGRLTGEWIIYDEHEGEKYYLCLARHTDGDEAIFAKLAQFVFPEFPFLQDKYGDSGT